MDHVVEHWYYWNIVIWTGENGNYNNSRLKISRVNDNNVIWLLVIYKGLIMKVLYFPLYQWTMSTI